MALSDIHSLFLFPDGVGTVASPVALRDFYPEVSDTHRCDSLKAQPTGDNAMWQTSRCGPFSCQRSEVPSLPAPVHVCGLCPSSFDMANFFVSHDLLPEWGSVIVSAQSSGKGQLGRKWHSPCGNMYASLRLPMREPFDGFAAAPALGAFIAHSLHGMGYDVRLKWPNDIIVMEGNAPRKAGGILLEERQGALVAGIGINLASAPEKTALREGHALEGGCLPALPVSENSFPPPIDLWLRLVGGIKFWYEQVPSPAMNAVQHGWSRLAEQYLLYMGVQVNIVDGNNDRISLRGTVSGLAPDGGLLLQSGNTIHTIHSGSLVPV